MDNTDEMMRLKNRGLLPSAIGRLVEAVGLEEVSAEAIMMVRDTIGLTEGQNLINRMAAKLVDTMLEAERQVHAMEQRKAADEKAQQKVDDTGFTPVSEPSDDELEAKRFARFLDTKGLDVADFDVLNEAERAILQDEYGHWDPDAAEPSLTWNERFIAWLETQQLTTQEYKAKTEREQHELRLAFAEVDTGAQDETTPPPPAELEPTPLPAAEETNATPETGSGSTPPAGEEVAASGEAPPPPPQPKPAPAKPAAKKRSGKRKR